MDRCVACGDEFDDGPDVYVTRFLCDGCFDVEREMVIEALADE
jgi:hypothetical protein